MKIPKLEELTYDSFYESINFDELALKFSGFYGVRITILHFLLSTSFRANAGIFIPQNKMEFWIKTIRYPSLFDTVLGTGYGNACDNFPNISNPDQNDSNNNLIGDKCETAEPGKTGVNTLTPLSGFELKGSDLFINDKQRGLIVKNSAGECFKVFINDKGNLSTQKITCPN